MRVEYQAILYEFDTENFLYYLSKGETFYTDYYELTVKKQNGRTCWYQSLSYKIDDIFVQNNYEKLKELYILFLSK